MTDDASTVTLAGKTYPVLQPAFRELSKIVPIVSEVFAGKGMSEETFEGLAKVVFYGLRRGTPDLTLEAVMDMPVSLEEMSAAALIVCQQAGLKKKEPARGEATGLAKPLTSGS